MGRDNAGGTQLNGPHSGKEGRQILLDRLECIGSRPHLQGGDEISFLMADIEKRPPRGIDLKIFALEIIGHPDVAIFIPGERRFCFAIFAR